MVERPLHEGLVASVQFRSLLHRRMLDRRDPRRRVFVVAGAFTYSTNAGLIALGILGAPVAVGIAQAVVARARLPQQLHDLSRGLEAGITTGRRANNQRWGTFPVRIEVRGWFKSRDSQHPLGRRYHGRIRIFAVAPEAKLGDLQTVVADVTQYIKEEGSRFQIASGGAYVLREPTPGQSAVVMPPRGKLDAEIHVTLDDGH